MHLQAAADDEHSDEAPNAVAGAAITVRILCISYCTHTLKWSYNLAFFCGDVVYKVATESAK